MSVCLSFHLSVCLSVSLSHSLSLSLSVSQIQDSHQDLSTDVEDSQLAKLHETIADKCVDIGLYGKAVDHYIQVVGCLGVDNMIYITYVMISEQINFFTVLFFEPMSFFPIVKEGVILTRIVVYLLIFVNLSLT